MKKIILSLCVLSLCSGTAYATCNGGTMRGGFCVSNVGLNWWSAAAWCQANGMSLASIYDICPDWDGNIGNSKCSRIIDSSFSAAGWTATASSTNYAYIVGFDDAGVSNRSRDYNNYNTLCN